MSGRIRTIKPELLEDEKTAGLSDGAFRLFVGTILLADDYGNLAAHEHRLSAAIFWHSRDSRECSRELRECVDAGLITLYVVNGQVYAHLNGWARHQRVDKPGRPKVPKPSDGKKCDKFEDSRDPCETFATASRDSRAALVTDREEEKEKEEEEERGAREHAPAPPTPKARRRKTQAPAELPEDWEPPETCLADFRARGFDALGCLARFRHYWRDGKGSGTKRADWALTFWNWAEREAKDGRLPLVADDPEPSVPPAPIEPLPEVAPLAAEFRAEMTKLLNSMPKARSWEDA